MFNDKRRVWMMLWLCSCVVVANMKTAHWQRERSLWCACWISLRSSSVMWTATLSPFVPVTMATTSQWCWMVTMCLKNTVRAGRHVKGRNLTKEHNLLISLMCVCVAVCPLAPCNLSLIWNKDGAVVQWQSGYNPKRLIITHLQYQLSIDSRHAEVWIKSASALTEWTSTWHLVLMFLLILFND